LSQIRLQAKEGRAMSLLERVIRAHRCRSTHHFIAMDALDLLSCEAAPGWKSLFLVHHEHLLKGAKAPDERFKDFRNHVCHVQEGLWGGAPGKALEWYGRSVDLLRRRRWSEAAYALGVLSHYYADPLQPFHTAQTEEENVIHRAVEWSIAKSRGEIGRVIAETGYPDIALPEGPGFVAEMVITGATVSNAFYQDFIDHYDFEAGAANPLLGMDDHMRGAVAYLIAYATAGFAAILGRAIEEAAVAPPKTSLTLQGYIECLDIPLRRIAARLEDAADRIAIDKIRKEYEKTGKVIRALPDDDKAIRRLHALEVRRIPLKALNREPLQPIGSAHVPPLELSAGAPEPAAAVVAQAAPEPAPKPIARPAPPPKPARASQAEIDMALEEMMAAETAPAQGDAAPRSPRLGEDSPLVDAPSIGRKTAKRLAKAGLTTVGDLMGCDPDSVVAQLGGGYITRDAITAWQHQSRLMMTVPGLRVHDAQVLAGAGITTREELAAAPAADLFELAMEFLTSPDGGRVAREEGELDEADVKGWIGLARSA
jgi:predicted flap endonuclease-1-like 5' DNA nuclease